MSEKYKFHDPYGIYFISPTIVHWIDLFTRKEYKRIVVDALRFCQSNKGLVVHAWVIMPSHLHLIIRSREESLSCILRDFKKHLNRALIKEIKSINESRRDWLLRAFESSGKDLKRISKYKIWQDGNHPIHLESNAFMQKKLDYLHNNPVEAEIVDTSEGYIYSSACDYAVQKGLLEVEFIE